MKRLISCSFLFFNMFLNSTYAQNLARPNVDVNHPAVNLPKNPQVSHLFDFKPYNVDHASGSVNIDIPIATIETGRIKFPVSISYKTTGIRVMDIATPVGLGWSLNAGYCVSVNEQNTSLPYSYRAYKSREQFRNQYDNMNDKDHIFRDLMDTKNGYIPSVRTIYNFICGEYKGSFFYDDDLQLKFLTPNPNFRVEALSSTSGQLSSNPSTSRYVEGFAITTPNGIKYIYRNKEYSQQSSASDRPPPEFPTSYWISEIEDLINNKKVNFEYFQKPVMYQDFESFYIAYPLNSIVNVGGAPPNISCQGPCVNRSYFTVKNIQIKRIIYDGGTIEFNYESTRPEIDKIKLNTIAVFQKNTPYKEITLYHSYFNNIRLKLDSVKLSSIYNAPVYRFSYNTSYLPPYPNLQSGDHISNTDYFGFYNPEHRPMTLPKYVYDKYTSNGDPYLLNNSQLNYSNYRPKPFYTQASVLTSITYPTGGKAMLEYENHSFGAYLNNMFDSSGTLGGLRIKTIKYYPFNIGSAPIIKTFQYNKCEFLTPGVDMYDYTKYKMFLDNITIGTGSDAHTWPVTTVSNSIHQYSEPLFPFLYYNGSPVLYTSVDEIDGTDVSKTGKTSYFFNYNWPRWVDYDEMYYFKDQGAYKYIYNADHSRGQLSKKEIFRKSSNGYHLISKDSLTYLNYGGAWPGAHMGVMVTPNYDTTGNVFPGYNPSDTSTSKPIFSADFIGTNAMDAFYREWNRPGIDMEKLFRIRNVYSQYREYRMGDYTTIYYDSSKSLQNQKKYYYDNPSHNLVTRIEGIDSKGVPVKTILKYVQDQSNLSGTHETSAFNKMLELNNLTDVIEKEEFVNSKLQSRIRNFYSLKNNGKDYVPYISSTRVSNFINGIEHYLNTYYEKDIYDNIIEERIGYSDVANSYIWDSDGQNIIASFKNSRFKDVAYTSFENKQTGKWVYDLAFVQMYSNNSLSGQNYYNLNTNNAIKTNLTAGNTYKLSYWSKNGYYTVSGNQSFKTLKNVKGWTLFEHIIIPTVDSVSISGIGAIDELRVNPIDAEVNTYCYGESSGLITKINPNATIQNYEYDLLGRITTIKDENNKVLKLFEYNFGNAPNNSSPNWDIVSYRCVQNTTGVNTGDRERLDKDINPFSSTYNQTRWINIGLNINSCPIGYVEPIWSNLGSTRCDGNGYLIQEQIDTNSLSPTYNQHRLQQIKFDTTICPIQSYEFKCKNLSAKTIHVTIKRTSTGTIIINDAFVYVGWERVLSTLRPDYYDIIITDDLSRPTTYPYKIYIQDNLQVTPNNSLLNFHVTTPLSMRVTD